MDTMLKVLLTSATFRSLLAGNWGHVFSQQFSGDMNIQNLLYIIARARNEASHPDTEDLDAEYTSVVLYHIVEVLGEINAPDARAKVEGFRNKLLQPEESNPLILDLPDDTKAERSIYKESGSKPRQTTPQGRKTETRLRVTVSDRPEKYNTYFQALLDELREQHNFTRVLRVRTGQNFYNFASGFTSIGYVARFTNVGTVHTYLLLRFGDKQTTKNFFDILNLPLSAGGLLPKMRASNSRNYILQVTIDTALGKQHLREGKLKPRLRVTVSDRPEKYNTYFQERESEINARFDVPLYSKKGEPMRRHKNIPNLY